MYISYLKTFTMDPKVLDLLISLLKNDDLVKNPAKKTKKPAVAKKVSTKPKAPAVPKEKKVTKKEIAAEKKRIKDTEKSCDEQMAKEFPDKKIKLTIKVPKQKKVKEVPQKPTPEEMQNWFEEE